MNDFVKHRGAFFAGIGVVWLALIGTSLYSAITGHNIEGGGDYSTVGQIEQGAFALGFFLIGWSTTRLLMRLDRESRAQARKIRERQEAASAPPPTIEYGEGD